MTESNNHDTPEDPETHYSGPQESDPRDPERVGDIFERNLGWATRAFTGTDPHQEAARKAALTPEQRLQEALDRQREVFGAKPEDGDPITQLHDMHEANEAVRRAVADLEQSRQDDQPGQ
jgi:hypothetical protein